MGIIGILGPGAGTYILSFHEKEFPEKREGVCYRNNCGCSCSGVIYCGILSPCFELGYEFVRGIMKQKEPDRSLALLLGGEDMITREKALELLKRHNKEDFHIRHALTVECVMRWFAKELGFEEDAEYWGLVGLLHDVDFEEYPEEHCKSTGTFGIGRCGG